jgi:hypothetical protein
MKKSMLLATVLCFGTAIAASASDYPRVDEDIQSVDERLAFLRHGFASHPVAPKDKEWVKRKLQHMIDLDATARDIFEIPVQRHYTDDERADFMRRMDERRVQIDRQNVADLQKLLELYHWFPVSEFGAGADSDAWMLVQHADVDLQRQAVTIAEPLAARHETNSNQYAWFFDRVAPNLQRYGTLGKCAGPGDWEPFPVEDPENLDARRAEIGLEPIADYKRRFAPLCTGP